MNGDDTPALKEVLARLRRCGGGTIYLPLGIYNTKETLELPSNVRVQGATSMEAGACQLRLGSAAPASFAGAALFRIPDGARGVEIRDIELRSLSSGLAIYPRRDYATIASEGTAGVRFEGVSGSVSLDNVRIVNFTRGIEAPAGSTPRAVRLRSVALFENATAVRIATANADNWLLQNVNVVEMAAGQVGIDIERSGSLSITQLSCASTLHNSGACVSVREHGYLALQGIHAEGARPALHIRATASPQSASILLKGNALGAGVLVEGFARIDSIGNGYGGPTIGSFGAPPRFAGIGMGSEVRSCGDVFFDPSNGDATHARVDLPFAGLPESRVQRCASFGFDVAAPIATGLPMPRAPFVTRRMLVTDFGAVDGGDPAENARAFQRALDAARTSGALGGVSIVVPAGTFAINKTLDISRGTLLQGAGGASVLKLVTPGVPLLRVNVLARTSYLPGRSIAIRDLALEGTGAPATAGTTAVSLQGASNCVECGYLSDVQLERLRITGFTRGVLMWKDPAEPGAHPMIDSVALRDFVLERNWLGFDLGSQNASNVLVENMLARGLAAGYRGMDLNGPGNVIVRNFRCEGISAAETGEGCVDAQARGAMLELDSITMTHMRYALHFTELAGYSVSPVVLRNSRLEAGVYFSGKIHLTSSGNTYGALYFAPGFVLRGEASEVRSCRDRAIDPATGAPKPLVFPGLLRSAVLCPPL